MAFVSKRGLPRLNTWSLFSIMSFQSTFGEHLNQDFNRSKIKSLFCLSSAFSFSFCILILYLVPRSNNVIMIIILLKKLRQKKKVQFSIQMNKDHLDCK